MTQPAPQKWIIDPQAILKDLDEYLTHNKVPAYIVGALKWFVIIYAAGISVAGLHAWAWSALPGTIGALIRIIGQALYGQAVHEETVREMIESNKQTLPGQRRVDLGYSGALPGPNGPVITDSPRTTGGGSIRVTPPATAGPGPQSPAPPPAAHP